MGPRLTQCRVCRAEAYLRTKWHLDLILCSRLAIRRPKIGGSAPFGEGARSHLAQSRLG